MTGREAAAGAWRVTARATRWTARLRPRRGRQTRGRTRAGPRHHDVRGRARAQRRRRRHRRVGCPAARAVAPYRQHEDRPADGGLAPRRRHLHNPGRPARRPRQAHSDAVDQHRPVEHRVAGECVRRHLLDVADHAPGARGGDRDGRPRDRLAHRRLFPGERARPCVCVHSRRRDRGHGGRLHHQRLGGQSDRLEGGVPAALDPGLLPRAGARSHRARAAARRAELARAGRRRPTRRRGRGRRSGRRQRTTPRRRARTPSRRRRTPPTPQPRNSPTRPRGGSASNRTRTSSSARTHARSASSRPCATS